MTWKKHAIRRLVFAYLLLFVSLPVVRAADGGGFVPLSGRPQRGVHYTVPLGDGVDIRMVWIETGVFAREPQSGERRPWVRWEADRRFNMRFVDGFWIATTPVTQAQYERVMGDNPSRFAGADRPVESVTWDEAVQFARELSRLTDGVFGLPTEARWEYACRAGTSTDYSFGNDPGMLDDHAWYVRNSRHQTHPVALKQPNAWGLYDMHGNVWEWCADWFAPYPGGTAVEYEGPETGTRRVQRGGSWFDTARHLRSAARGARRPDDRSAMAGFRVVMDMPASRPTDIPELQGAVLAAGCVEIVDSPFVAPHPSHRRREETGGLLYMNPETAPWGRDPRPDMRHIEWTTASAPDPGGSERIAFVWGCAMPGVESEHVLDAGETPLNFVLTVGEGDDARRITFHAAAGPSSRWSEGGVVLGFDTIYRTQWQEDVAFMWLSLPADDRLLQTGRELRLRVAPEQDREHRIFYILFPDPDVP